jgi:hypothetical protein
MREVVWGYDIDSAEGTVPLLLEPGADAVLVELVAARVQCHQVGSEIEKCFINKYSGLVLGSMLPMFCTVRV